MSLNNQGAMADIKAQLTELQNKVHVLQNKLEKRDSGGSIHINVLTLFLVINT